jgi:hypothetical protein
VGAEASARAAKSMFEIDESVCRMARIRKSSSSSSSAGMLASLDFAVEILFRRIFVER